MALTKVSTGMINTSAASVDLDIDNGTFYIDVNSGRVGVSNSSPATALDVTGTATATLFSGSGASLTSIPNAALDNSSITINSYSTSLGGTVTLSTSDVGEGTNLYYTDARWDTKFAAASTTGLSEGTNLYYTDARADARVSLIVDAAPETLNTLNELAAALGDDANFSTTVTNSIATKLPLAGGTMTGTLTIKNPNVSGEQIIFGIQNAVNTGLIGKITFNQTDDKMSLSNEASGPLVFDTATVERLRITSTGNVGIGTDSPQRLLHVNGTEGAVRFTSTASGNDGFEVGIGTSSQAFLWQTENAFMHFATNNVERMRIDSSGNVGIGTSSPATGLEVGTTNYTFSGTTYNIYGLFGDTSGGVRLGADSSNDDSVIGTTGTNDLQFVTYDGSAWASRMTLTNTGNVGIGTDSPKQKVHSTNGFYTTGGIASPGTPPYTSYSGASFDWFDGYARFYSWGADATTRGGYSFIQLQSDGESQQTAMTIDASGNVGIGTGKNLELQTTSGVTRGYISAQEFNTGGTHAAGLIIATSSGESITFKDNNIGGTTNMVIKGDGKVGIGTASPASRLDVEADEDTWIARIYNTGSDANAQGLLVRSDATAAHDAPVMGVYADGGYKMLVRSTGNVGIGTDSPGAKFHIVGQNPSGLIVENGLGLASTQPYVSMAANNYSSGFGTFRWEDQRTSQSSPSFIWEVHDGSGTVLAYDFRTGATGAAGSKLAITQDGNVGIGTDSPSDRLVVQKDSATIEPILVLKNDNTTDDNGTSIDFSGKDTSGNNIIYGRITAKYTNHATEKSHMIFTHRNDSGTFSEWMRVTHDGNVGIGTDTPGVELDIKRTANTYPLRIQSVGGQGRAIAFADVQTTPTKYNWIAGAQYNTNNAFEITPSTAVGGYTFSTPAITVLETGNVGIGTTSPDFKLHVSHDGGGDASFTGGILVENTGTPAGEPNLAFKNQDTGSNYWFTGLNQDTNYALTYGPTFEDPYNLFTLTSGGNLGVGGDPDPDERLVVTGSANGGSTAIVVQNEYSLASSVDESTDLQFRFYSAQTDNYTSGAMIRSTKTEDWITTADASAELVFYTREDNALTPKMTILPSGNVGIGDTSPDFKLAIRTPAIPSGSTYAWPLDLSRSNTDSRGLSFGIGVGLHAIGAHNGDITLGQTFGLDSNSLPQFYETMRVWHDGTASAGRVGIGTTSPVTNLHVKAAGNATGPTDVLTIETSRGDVGTAFTGGSIVFVNSDTNSAGQARIKVGSANDAAPIGLNEENSQSFIFETSTGGSIGTTNIDGNATTITVTHAAYTLVVGQRVAITAGTYAGSYTIDTVLSNTQFTIADTAHDLAADTTTRVMQFGIPTDSMIIRADGNVGIGTNTPSAKLDVNGDATFTGDSTAASYEFNSNSIFYGKIGVASGPSFFYTGTATPGSFWDINNLSNGNLIMTLSDAGAMSIAGTLTQSASDERLKENIQPITNALEKLNLLRGVEFDWKDNIEGFSPEQKHETGVIAQEVEKVMPDAVVPAPFNKEYKTVHKDKLIALLIEAVKELQQEVELLKNNS